MSRKSPRIDMILRQTKAPMSGVSKTITKKAVKKEIKTEIKREIKLEDEIQVKVEVPIRALDNRDPNIPTTNGAPVSVKTEYVLQDAIAHLCSVDHRFGPLFSRYTPKPWTAEGMSEPKCHFKSLTLSIISQQVSGAAARSIGKKFVGLFRGLEHSGVNANVDMDPEVEDEPKVKLENGPEGNLPSGDVVVPPSAAPANDALADSFYPTAEQVAACEVLYLKSAGLSLRKAEYILGIAQAFANKDLTDEFFATADDEAIKTKLVSLRGIGPWSAEMFMMFSLQRWDVLSPGDIGIQRGLSYWTGRNPKDKSKHNKNKAQKYMTEAEMISATAAWQPFRSIGCWAMWRVDGEQEECPA